MKVALCFIISYDHVLHKEALWKKWIQPNQDIINPYFHYKQLDAISSPWIKMYAIPPQNVHATSYFHVVPAYMSLLLFAYAHDVNNQWFCLLTDTCVPLVSPEEFRARFMALHSQSIIKCKPAYWDISMHRRANLRLLDKEFWLANDPWFVLCRAHVLQCIMFISCKRDLYHKINAGGIANESLFAIVLQTFPKENREADGSPKWLNESSTVSDWTRMSSPTSPYLFKEATEENKQVIAKLLEDNPQALFLRKVHRDFPDESIMALWQTKQIHPQKKYTKTHTHIWLILGLPLLVAVSVTFYCLLFHTCATV